MFDLKRILRALLISTSDPLSIKDVQTLISRYHQQVEESASEAEEDAAGESAVSADGDGQGVMRALLEQVPSLLTSTQIRDAMEAIGQDMVDRDEPFRLREGANGYQLVVASDMVEWVRLLRDEPRPQRLSPSQLETLAIVAYRQPVTRSEIEAVRGVSSDSALSKLLERELVYVVGRAELPGRPIQYGTSEQFLEFCGIKGLEELPASDVLSPMQITEWIRQANSPTEAPSDADVGLAVEPPTAQTEN